MHSRSEKNDRLNSSLRLGKLWPIQLLFYLVFPVLIFLQAMFGNQALSSIRPAFADTV